MIPALMLLVPGGVSHPQSTAAAGSTVIFTSIKTLNGIKVAAAVLTFISLYLYVIDHPDGVFILKGRAASCW